MCCLHTVVYRHVRLIYSPCLQSYGYMAIALAFMMTDTSPHAVLVRDENATTRFLTTTVLPILASCPNGLNHNVIFRMREKTLLVPQQQYNSFSIIHFQTLPNEL